MKNWAESDWAPVASVEYADASQVTRKIWGPFQIDVFYDTQERMWDCRIGLRLKGFGSGFECPTYVSTREAALRFAERFIRVIKDPENEKALEALAE